MITIPVKVCGDHWLNPNEVQNLLQQNQHQDVIELNIGGEGPDLEALGVVDAVLNSGIPAQRFTVTEFANPKQQLPFARVAAPLLSHFIWMNDHYWTEPKFSVNPEFIFGFFIGRTTPARAVMMYEVVMKYAPWFLTSCMRTRPEPPWKTPTQGVNLERLEDWLPPQQQPEFVAWWDTARPCSIDAHEVNDQYSANQNTNQDLLQYYDRFDIELVAESYTLGNTFFMTEKTVRPIMAGKPLLVYGPKNYLRRLRDLGFVTWGDLWDEDYDKLQGPLRWQAIKQTLEHIIKCHDQPSWRERFLQHSTHNRRVLEELKNTHRPRYDN